MSRKTIDFYEYMPTTPEGFARVWWRDGVLNFEDVLLPKSGAFELYTIEQMRDYAMHAVKRALEQQPADEPVAWMWSHKIAGDVGTYFEDPSKFFDLTKPSDYEWTPLFRRSQPATPTEHPAAPSAGSSAPQGAIHLRSRR